MMDVLPNLIVVIILQSICVSDHHVVHLMLTRYVNNISNWGKKNKSHGLKWAMEIDYFKILCKLSL